MINILSFFIIWHFENMIKKKPMLSWGNLETDQETWSVRFPHDEKLKYLKRKFSPELEKNMY